MLFQCWLFNYERLRKIFNFIGASPSRDRITDPCICSQIDILNSNYIFFQVISLSSLIEFLSRWYQSGDLEILKETSYLLAGWRVQNSGNAI